MKKIVFVASLAIAVTLFVSPQLALAQGSASEAETQMEQLTRQLNQMASQSGANAAIQASNPRDPSSYRSLTRYDSADQVMPKSPFAKLKDFSFGKSTNSETKSLSFAERFGKFRFKKPSLGKSHPGLSSSEGRLGFGKMLSTGTDTKMKAPGFMERFSAKTKSLFSRKPATETTPNWDQASQELREQALNLLRESKEAMNQRQLQAPAIQPPVRSANSGGVPNVRY